MASIVSIDRDFAERLISTKTFGILAIAIGIVYLIVCKLSMIEMTNN
jgi:hypothetical protein